MKTALENMTAYAKGEMLSEESYSIVDYIFKSFALGELKEKICNEILGYDQSNESIHGKDGYNNGRGVEHKTEKKPPLSGEAAWSSTKDFGKLRQLIDSDQEYCQSGWTRKGRLIYVLSMNLNDTDIPHKIGEYISKNQYNPKPWTPKTGHKHFGNADVNLVYFNEKYAEENIFSGPFLNKIKNYG